MSKELRHRLEAHAEQEKRRNAEQECASLRRQLNFTLSALERARSVKPVRLTPAKPKRKLKDDLIRVGLGDLHGARMDKGAVAAALADIKALDPDEIILGGDLVDCGGFLAQHHTLGYVAETDYSYEEDIACAAGFLDALAAAAPRAVIIYIEGNHERRVETWCVTETLRHRRDSEMLRRALAPEYQLQIARRGIVYKRISECYDNLSVPGVIKRGSCYFFHGITTSKHAAAMTLLRTSGNSVFFHTHRAQSDIQRRVNVGIIGAWNPGCLCIPQPLWQHGAPTDWTHGIAVQFVNRSNRFLHLNIPIIDGTSDFASAFRHAA